MAYSYLYHTHIFFSKFFDLVNERSCDTGNLTSVTTVIGGKWCCGNLFSYSSLETKNKSALFQELY